MRWSVKCITRSRMQIFHFQCTQVAELTCDSFLLLLLAQQCSLTRSKTRRKKSTLDAPRQLYDTACIPLSDPPSFSDAESSSSPSSSSSSSSSLLSCSCPKASPDSKSTNPPASSSATDHRSLYTTKWLNKLNSKYLELIDSHVRPKFTL